MKCLINHSMFSMVVVATGIKYLHRRGHTFTISRQLNPATKAVAVIMAGMILPTIILVLNLSIRPIEYTVALKLLIL